MNEPPQHSRPTAPVETSDNGRTPRSRALLLGLIAAGVILALTCSGFQDGFRSPLFTDDYVWINHYIGRSTADVLGDYLFFFTHDLLGTRGFGHFYRPLPRAVFTTGWLMFGFRVWGYHLLTFLVHLACVGAVGWLGMRLARSVWAGLAAALFFALHPSHGIAVTWVCAISDPLYTLFFTLGAGWLVRMIDLAPADPFASPRRNRLLYGLYALALMSKESAMTFPLIAFVVVSVLQAPPWRFWRSRSHRWFFGTLAVMTVAYFLWRMWVCGGVAGYGTHTAFPLDRMQANAWELLKGSTFYFSDLDRLIEPLGWLQLTLVFCALLLLKLLASPDDRFRRAALAGVLWIALANVISLNVTYKPWYNYITSVGAAAVVGATIAAPLPAIWPPRIRRILHAGAAVFVGLLAAAHLLDLRLWNERWGEMTAREFDRIAVFKRQIPHLPDGLTLYCEPPMAHAKWWMYSYFEFIYQRRMHFTPVVHAVNHPAIRPRQLDRTVFFSYDAQRRRIYQVMNHYDIVRRVHAPYDPRYNHFLSWEFDEKDFTQEMLLLGPDRLTFPPPGQDPDHRALARQLRYILFPDNRRVFIFKRGGYYPAEAEIGRRRGETRARGRPGEAQVRDGRLILNDIGEPRVLMINVPYFFDTAHNPCEVRLRWATDDPAARVTFFWAAHALIFPLEKVKFHWTPLDGGNGPDMKTFRIDCDFDPYDKTDLWIWSGRAHRVGLLLEGRFDEVEVDAIRFLN
ncbi:MAG: hypothetical protein Kow0059_17100 [Candidatus Sumerlaeia bacterium]